MDGILVPISLFAALAAVSWVVIASIRQVLVTRTHATVQMRLLDKLPSGESALAYSQSSAAQRAFGDLLESATSPGPYRSILNGVQAAILLSVFGATLLLLHRNPSFSSDGVLAFGAISLALGIGFALAAAATYLLSSSFGLLTSQKLP